jgi:multiple sugar transport system substrate-binding protein
MKIQKFGTAVASALLFASVVLTACGQKAPNESSAGGKDASGAALYSHLSKPVTIVFQSAYNETTAESVEQTMFKRIREKFPNVNPVYIQRGKGSTIQDLIVAGNVPDILWGNLSTVNEMVVNTGLSYDLSPLVKQFNLDLGIFPQAALDAIKNTNEKGELLGLPKNNLKPSVLFYNKDIFDKFGVPYPKDGMTWDETFDLAKKMTRLENGQQIYGFTMFVNSALRDNSLSVPVMDPKEDKLYGAEQWALIFNNFRRFFEIPGNQWKDQDKMFSQGKAAMMVDLITSHGAFTKAGVNWDIASLPVYKEKPGVGSRINYDFYFITSTSKNKEAAFELITYLLSEEFQLGDAKDGMLPSISSIDILKVFGENVEGLRSKNLRALTVNRPADALPRRNPGLSIINTDTLVRQALERVVTGKEDVNTALRNLDEEIRKRAEEDKASKK